MNVGSIIKKKREEMNLSQNQLAKRAGISQAALSSLEAETTKPNIETVFLLAKALNCSVPELLGIDDNNSELEPMARALLNIYNQLNDAGKSMLIAQAEIILQQPAMRKKSSTSSEAI